MLRSSVQLGNAGPMAVQSRMHPELLRYVMRGERGILMRRALGIAIVDRTEVTQAGGRFLARIVL